LNRLVLGTRGSALALAQASLTEQALAHYFPALEVRREIFTTRGDQKLDLSLLRAGEAGGKGLFTKELEDALFHGRIDVAVHSLKDLPGQQPEGLRLCAVLERAPVGDVLITRECLRFEDLPEGAKIGTSSVRRARQLQWLRPDLVIEEWRGNVPTRLRKLDERVDVAGIVLAEAGMLRLGHTWVEGRLFDGTVHRPAVSLAPKLWPAIGQGAIALQTRCEDREAAAVLAPLNHDATWTCIRAERELQRLLAGDCALPVGVRTRLDGDSLSVSVLLFGRSEGQPAIAEFTGSACDPEAVAAGAFAALESSSALSA
jgi:hydroxymethylbilane synthase